MFRKLLSLIVAASVVLAVLAPISQAQTYGPKDFGYAFAADYSKWVFRSTASVAATAATITISGDAFANTPAGRTFYPLNTNAPLLIDIGANQETVTPSAVTCTQNSLQSSCTFTATFSNAHNPGVSITSATFGIQEAINDLPTGGGTVIVSNYFGGTTATITSTVAGGATKYLVVDVRNGAETSYFWTGSAYAVTGNVPVKGVPQYVFVAANVATAGATIIPITGLSWTIPANTAVNYPFHCEITFNQATAATANTFSITTATQAPTNGTLWGWSSTAATTATRTVTKGYNVTTATPIIVVTPTLAADEIAYLDGFIEQPTNAATVAVTISITTVSGATDITTVARDSFCRLF